MEDIIPIIWQFLSQFWESVIDFSESTTFAVIKFIVFIYIVVVIVDIILLLVQRGIKGDIRATIYGMDMPKDLVLQKSKIEVKWGKIRKRLASDNPSEYKVAIIEADNVLEKLVKELKYGGNNLGEMLENMPENEIEVKSDLMEAHEVRNKIIHDESFSLTKDEAKNTLEKYEKFLRYFLVIG